jgi:hypothetical protein
MEEVKTSVLGADSRCLPGSDGRIEWWKDPWVWVFTDLSAAAEGLATGTGRRATATSPIRKTSLTGHTQPYGNVTETGHVNAHQNCCHGSLLVATEPMK